MKKQATSTFLSVYSMSSILLFHVYFGRDICTGLVLNIYVLIFCI